MARFRLPLIATGVGFGGVVLVGALGLAWILNSAAPDKIKEQRAGLFGSGLAGLYCLGIAPFWIYAAAKLGQDRRDAQKRQSERGPTRKKKSKE